MSTIPSPANMDEAAAAVRAGLGYLAALDPATLPACAQARLLQVLEEAHALETVARARGLRAFTAGQGYHDDGCYGARSWLTTRLGVTKAAATAYLGWARRAAAHPRVLAALAARDMSESYGRTICDWTGQLPPECQDSADAILVAAARSGASLADLARLAAEIYARSRPPDPDGPDGGFGDRSVRLETTFGGAGVLGGDLTPECAAVVGAVLDALSAPAGAGDLRTHGQRYHDALADAMQRLLGAGLLPGRAGQPVRAWAHMSLAELLALDGDGALLGQWTAVVRARWAGHRAAASAGGSGPDNADPDDADREPAAAAAAPSGLSREALERAIIGKAVELLSGPGGLASFLRRQQLGAPLAGPSLPLDIGYSATVPAAIRHAVTLRDQHCRWAGGCGQPAAACQVHHVRHKANGGPTSVKDCILLCFFHHQVVIHRWGWTLVLNPDGTTTAWNPDRTKVLHSHGPPARAG